MHPGHSASVARQSCGQPRSPRDAAAGARECRPPVGRTEAAWPSGIAQSALPGPQVSRWRGSASSPAGVLRVQDVPTPRGPYVDTGESLRLDTSLPGFPRSTRPRGGRSCIFQGREAETSVRKWTGWRVCSRSHWARPAGARRGAYGPPPHLSCCLRHLDTRSVAFERSVGALATRWLVPLRLLVQASGKLSHWAKAANIREGAAAGPVSHPASLRMVRFLRHVQTVHACLDWQQSSWR